MNKQHATQAYTHTYRFTWMQLAAENDKNECVECPDTYKCIAIYGLYPPRTPGIEGI
jgi:hypothetical protein